MKRQTVTRAHRGFTTVYGQLGRDFARWGYEWYYGECRYVVPLLLLGLVNIKAKVAFVFA